MASTTIKFDQKYKICAYQCWKHAWERKCFGSMGVTNGTCLKNIPIRLDKFHLQSDPKSSRRMSHKLVNSSILTSVHGDPSNYAYFVRAIADHYRFRCEHLSARLDQSQALSETG